MARQATRRAPAPEPVDTRSITLLKEAAGSHALFRVGLEVLARSGVEPVVEAALEHAYALVETDVAVLALRRGQELHYYWRTRRGTHGPAVQPLSRRRTASQPRPPAVRRALAGARSWLRASLRHRDADFGELILVRRENRSFERGQQQLMEAVALMAALALDNTDLAKAVTAERNRAEAILENMAEAVLVADDSLRVISMNAAAAAMTGRRPGQAAGLPLDAVLPLTDIDGQALPPDASPAARALTAGARVQERVWLRGANGKLTCLECTAIPASGAAAGPVAVIMRDVTPELALARIKDEFVSVVSHELRSPLTALMGITEGLRALPDMDPKRTRGWLDIMQREIERMSAILDDLLRLSRIESGRVALNVEELDLRALVDQVTAVLKQRPERPAFRVHVDGPLPSLRADPARMTQVLHNVLENAVKYGSPQRPIRVTLGTHRGEDGRAAVRVTVRDRGPGIPEEDLERIFQPFYRSTSREANGPRGTGLGLAIARSLVARHGGRIRAENAPGGGALFTISIPLHRTQASTRPPRASLLG
jgi:signal transduction histidine kinase